VTAPDFPFDVAQPSAAIANSRQRFPVRRIYCVGRNYVEHIREMKEGDERDLPFFFQKPADSLLADGDTMPYPTQTTDLHFEVELVAAIGTAARDVPVEGALDHVFGYAVGLDMTRRDLQREMRERRLPWEAGKSFDHSAPCGPLVPAALGHPAADAAISLTVNGEGRQHGTIGQMIWSVAEIISNLSRAYALHPGDLIFTGTPAGVGAVVPGDALLGRIDGVGALDIRIGPGKN
jgi:fumarylpyruvate hydrolase